MQSVDRARSGSVELSPFTPALILLGVAIVLNYADRGNLSIAAPIMTTQLNLSATQMGFLFSAFFYTYTAMQFVVGRAVDRLGANLVLSAGLLIWSLATIATGFAGGFVILFLLRMVLGVGESVAFPCTSKLIAQHVPSDERGLANGVITAGLKLGPAVGTFAAGMLMVNYGWRPVFWGMGVASLLWLPAWLIWKPAGKTGGGSPDYLVILRQPQFWGCATGHFSFNYFSYFFLSWLPLYLAHERHLSPAELTRTASSYYLVEGSAALLTGWVCDVCIKRGARASLVRKTASAAGQAIAAFAMIACVLAKGGSYYPWLIIVGVASGMAACGVFLFAQTLAGPTAAGQWSALQNGFGNFAGLIGPTMTGFLVDRSGHYLSAFALAAAITLAGAVVWAAGVRFAPVNWATYAVPDARDKPTL